ncbi:hypothetical protein LTR36_000004 [Oleoguttula mirabilis]|uniref:C2H2-type domain-containing protein n=1 Tax=Oleoguttula mirabilis TaxID=1507867 RepID=A0AAV9JXD0_9PEZI|nr:hypothetical protein LTR36_000004 [Oleoguttula mirabilis]
MSSTTTTPTRPGRGIPLPDIDTRAQVSKSATALSLGGWLTPPQSAHESRRGSLAHSVLSEVPYSSASSMSAYSTPATPLHLGGQASDPFAQRWPHHSAGDAQMTADLSGLYPDSHMSQNLLHAGLQGTECAPESGHGMALYPNAGQRHSQEAFDIHMSSTAAVLEPWQHFDQAAGGNDQHNTGLQSTLYQSHPGMTVGSGMNSSTYGNASETMHSLSLDTSSATQFDGYVPASASFCQHPQVVVPSQLSPAEDWPMQQYQGYASPDQCVDEFASSFASTNTSFSGYGIISPPSPDEHYFVNSEDEGYLMVKHEPVTSPTPGASQLPYRSAAPTRASRHRSRSGRSTKRGKPQEPVAAYLNSKYKTMVVYEGKWRFGEHGEAFLETASPPSKPHKCPECTAKFERSEHLKRHQKKHTDTREYPCPLPGCDERAMSRSDNATDHFKTHLKGPRKGQRNKHFEYPTLRNRLLDVYSHKEAHKMIAKLEKACRDDNDLRGQRHHVI